MEVIPRDLKIRLNSISKFLSKTSEGYKETNKLPYGRDSYGSPCFHEVIVLRQINNHAVLSDSPFLIDDSEGLALTFYMQEKSNTCIKSKK